MTDNELLFEYLRDILFATKVQPPGRGALSPDSLRLYEGLNFLAECMEEYRAYARAMSGGNLAMTYYSRDNTLCHPLKTLHANLRHLTWQAKQVAGGDYSQEVSFLGEFSDAFNTMTRQLREREEQLKRTIERIEQQKEEMSQFNELLVEMTSRIAELIVVADARTGETLYVNKGETFNQDGGGYPALRERLKLYALWEQHPKAWDFESETDRAFFRIVTFAIDWNGQSAYANIVQDVTADWLKTHELEESSNRDPATGLYNRRYLMASLHSYVAGKIPFSLCFADLDNLKAVNDTFGHAEGDRYIEEVARQISCQIRRVDVCARVGGDEFVVLFRQCPLRVAEGKMLSAARRISAAFDDEGGIRRGISYGIVEADYAMPTDPEDLLDRADCAMYENKRRNKAEPEA